MKSYSFRFQNTVIITRSEEAAVAQPTPAQATATTEPQPNVLQVGSRERVRSTNNLTSIDPEGQIRNLSGGGGWE